MQVVPDFQTVCSTCTCNFIQIPNTCRKFLHFPKCRKIFAKSGSPLFDIYPHFIRIFIYVRTCSNCVLLFSTQPGQGFHREAEGSQVHPDNGMWIWLFKNIYKIMLKTVEIQACDNTSFCKIVIIRMLLINIEISPNMPIQLNGGIAIYRLGVLMCSYSFVKNRHNYFIKALVRGGELLPSSGSSHWLQLTSAV